ncbi:8-oxo-dGTP pyrophosphatase MutT (NUDIX family) [Lipingzhangella halophila]|uniref:8-oxo-dGTP pyrophosphatase MutT (NUDIX family) n=1 Tax=Lipingzhangella halophila TaxID=1783352 RepID=A0A7W7RP66_9ACTN|nr:NUDIX hydrolase [Lipingzhangella halophila]MBB4935620.1 8-oxo-dGTP pyrophosphatase MutT (NUDIX family) [Lipingzhangella halophila]
MQMEHPHHRDAREGGGMPREPDHAATVMLLRSNGASTAPEAEGLEVLLLRRARTMSFAPSVYAFAGGRVDPRDADLGAPGEDPAPSWWSGPDPKLWAERLRVPVPLARALVCAAVRETFEESGVLLAGESATDVITDTRGDDWEADRRSLIERSLSFSAFLERRGLILRSDLLLPWSRWITPRKEPRRYDTRFFAAVLPEGQQTRDFGEEHDHVLWMRPDDAVGRWRRGDLAMLTPTVATCEELANCGSLESVMAAERDIVPIEPEVRQVGGELRVVVPGGMEYPL